MNALDAVDTEKGSDVAVCDRAPSGDLDDDDPRPAVKSTIVNEAADPGSLPGRHDATDVECHCEERAVVGELGRAEQFVGHVVLHPIDTLPKILGESEPA